MADFNNERGEKPQNNKSNGKALSKTTKGVAKKASDISDRAAYYAALAGKGVSERLNTNLFPDLSAHEHRLALIESCINTNEIFNDDLRDPSDKSSKNIGDYMFYNQLYFMATAQLTQPSETGSLLPGLVGGLSMIAGAAFVSEDFRNNLKEHAEDSLLKYIEPFKESAPKLWHSVAARVESHPGCVSPESVAIKLMRYQRQADELVENGDISAKSANKLLLKKTAELKQAADEMNIEWDDVIEMKAALNKSMVDLEHERIVSYVAKTNGQNPNNILIDDDAMANAAVSHNACADMDAKEDGLSERTGNAKSWKRTSEWATPIDVQSAAEKLVTYQKQLQEAIEDLHNKTDGEKSSTKYSHLANKSEDEYLASSIKEVAELKNYAERVLGLDWCDITDKYDELNRADYDRYNKTISDYKKYTDGKGNKNAAYFDKLKEVTKAKEAAALAGVEYTGDDEPTAPTESAYRQAKLGIKKHNEYMYYELPVDADSAGRCLKKYQQDAYENVRDISTRHNLKHAPMDSGRAYQTANSLCRQVKAASSILGFDWNKSIREYRKDVFKTVLKDPSKSVIWKELSSQDVIANIPDQTITYIPQPDGPAIKQVVPLSYKERIEMWDGSLFDKNGNKLPDDSLIQVRNPYTEDEAISSYLGLFKKTIDLQLEQANIENIGAKTKKDVSAELASIKTKMADVEKQCDELNNSLIDDKFTVEIIDKIKDAATDLLNKQRQKYEERSTARIAQANEVKLDESLAPRDDSYGIEDDNDFTI